MIKNLFKSNKSADIQELEKRIARLQDAYAKAIQYAQDYYIRWQVLRDKYEPRHKYK